MKFLVLVLFILVIACGQQTHEPGDGHPQKAEIRQALVEMLSASTDPFLIVEELKTERFIQFYNDNGRILIDLPEDAVAPDRRGIARDFFKKHGIPMEETQDIDPRSGESFVNRSWTTTFPPDEADRVVDIALGALFEAHGMSNATLLTLTRGWE
ncbi:MAG: hypothetical protein QNK18_14645 [Gammaproteobacteria bacterium]|nr:hypothetical protein [Gammaproteobacteria bacterium]